MPPHIESYQDVHLRVIGTRGGRITGSYLAVKGVTVSDATPGKVYVRPVPVLRMGDARLRRVAEPVEDPAAPEVAALVDTMRASMVAAHGIGLAAPQIGISQRVVLYSVPAARNDGVEVPETVLINPVVTVLDPATTLEWEACLSVPGLAGPVPRARHVQLTWQDLQGATHTLDATGYHARVIQHECDHLDGILYPQRMEDVGALAYVSVLSGDEEVDDG